MGVVGFRRLACEEKMVEYGCKGNGEDVREDVFDREVAAEEDLASEGEAESVDGCDWDGGR